MQVLKCMMVAILALDVGCDPESGAEYAGEVELRPLGGVWLNTSSIGPLQFSELDLDGKLLDGLALTDVLLKRPNNQWLRMDAIDIYSGQIRGRRGETYYTGADLVGSRWLMSPSQGASVEMWISDYTAVSASDGRYTFQTLGPGGSTVSVCDPDSQGDRSAIAIKDITVDHETGDIAARKRTLYLACVSGAVGKARTWGYDSLWLSSFEAAVRMVRADYCYDGASWTTPGTPVQVRDLWDVNNFRFSQYATEAVWTATGLACLSQPRWAVVSAGQVTCGGAPPPTCPPNLTMNTYPGTLFWTKIGTN